MEPKESAPKYLSPEHMLAMELALEGKSRPQAACEACVWGRGEHAEWCPQNKSAHLLSAPNILPTRIPQNLLYTPGITLEWEDQDWSSALYVKFYGRIVGIRINIHKVAPGVWHISDCWDADKDAPKYLGNKGKKIGPSFCHRDTAKQFIDQSIHGGTISMTCLVDWEE